MLKYLLDANLSPETAKYLRKFDVSVRSIQEEQLGHLPDQEIISLAKKEDLIIVTFDYDFAHLWFFKEWGKIGVIHLRTRLQTVEYINEIVGNFMRSGVMEREQLARTLVVLDESGYRVER